MQKCIFWHFFKKKFFFSKKIKKNIFFSKIFHFLQKCKNLYRQHIIGFVKNRQFLTFLSNWPPTTLKHVKIWILKNIAKIVQFLTYMQNWYFSCFEHEKSTFLDPKTLIFDEFVGPNPHFYGFFAILPILTILTQTWPIFTVLHKNHRMSRRKKYAKNVKNTIFSIFRIFAKWKIREKSISS